MSNRDEDTLRDGELKEVAGAAGRGDAAARERLGTWLLAEFGKLAERLARQDAEDVLHDAVARVLQNMASPAFKANPRAYAIRAVQSAARDLRRRKRKHEPLLRAETLTEENEDRRRTGKRRRTAGIDGVEPLVRAADLPEVCDEAEIIDPKGRRYVIRIGPLERAHGRLAFVLPYTRSERWEREVQQREVLVARELHDRSYAEIAAYMGLSVPTVRRRHLEAQGLSD